MLKLPINTFPFLQTERLYLRKLLNSDMTSIYKLHSDENINKYLDRSKNFTISQAKEFIVNINNEIKNGKWIYWGITEKSKNELIGTICLWNFSEDKITAEVGYELQVEFQGKGLMQEALSKVLQYGFEELALEKILAFTHKDNEKSKRLLTKTRFRSENSILNAGRDELVYSITNSLNYL